MTREEWLQAAAALLRASFPEDQRPPEVRISVGLPAGGTRSKSIGECWPAEADEHGVPQIFLHPSLTDNIEILGVLAHELIHATLGSGKGHRAEFQALMKCLGLTGKPTATTPGSALTQTLRDITAHLGPFPHGQLRTTDGSEEKPRTQTTYMLKLMCSQCGYTVRTTQKWIDQGLPLCGICSDDVRWPLEPVE